MTGWACRTPFSNDLGNPYWEAAIFIVGSSECTYLVGGWWFQPTPLQNMSQLGLLLDDEIPNTVYGKIIQMFQSTNQIYIYIYLPPGREISMFNQPFYKSSDPDMNRPMKNLYGNNLDLNCQQTTMRT